MWKDITPYTKNGSSIATSWVAILPIGRVVLFQSTDINGEAGVYYLTIGNGRITTWW